MKKKKPQAKAKTKVTDYFRKDGYRTEEHALKAGRKALGLLPNLAWEIKTDTDGFGRHFVRFVFKESGLILVIEHDSYLPHQLEISILGPHDVWKATTVRKITKEGILKAVLRLSNDTLVLFDKELVYMQNLRDVTSVVMQKAFNEIGDLKK